MKLSFDIKNISILKKLFGNVGILLSVVLGLLILGVGWVIFGEVSKITQLKTDVATAQSKITRVNIDKHKEVEKWLDENAAFIPSPIIETDAFTPISEEEDTER